MKLVLVAADAGEETIRIDAGRTATSVATINRSRRIVCTALVLCLGALLDGITRLDISTPLVEYFFL